MKFSRAASRKPAKRTSVKTSIKPETISSLLSSEATLIVIISLVVVVCLVYANSLRNEFVFDDIYLVVEDQRLRTLSASLLFGYRPIRDISYALDFALWGSSPVGFHVTNILIHAANMLLVFALVRRLTSDLTSATIAALIFAVHPIQTDSVTYISGRRDLLFSVFYLLSFHTYLSYYRAKGTSRAFVYFILFLLFWALSLLSKEMAVSLPILIFLWHYCDSWEQQPTWRGQAWRAGRSAFQRDKWLWLLLMTSGVAFTAYWVLFKGASRRVRLTHLEYWGGSFYLNALTAIRVHAWYLKQLVAPTPIAQYLGAFEISRSIFELSFIVSFLLVGALIVTAFLLLNRDRLMSFAILSYFVLLLPVSQIIPHHELLADHYLYLPMMSFGLLVALVVRRINTASRGSGKAAYLAVGVAIVILGVMTIFQNRTWKDERTLWTINYAAVPNSPRAALNLGYTYQDSDPEKAEQLFKRALGLNPPPEIRKTLYDRLTVLLIERRKFDEAEFYVSDILSKAPHDFFGNLWASQVYLGKRECDKSGRTLQLAQVAAITPREVSLAERTARMLQQICGRAP